MKQGQFFNAVADVATVTVEPDPGLAVSGSLVVGRRDEPSVEGESILGGEKIFSYSRPVWSGVNSISDLGGKTKRFSSWAHNTRNVTP